MKTISEDGIKMLVAFEGEELKVYRDPVGLPTFGVGHLVTDEERSEFPVGKKITRAVSRQYLRQDLARFEACVNRSVKVPITQNQFDALVSLAFNIGEAGFKRSSVLRHLNNRKFEKAANAFGAWNKGTVNGRKVVIQGLVKRRATERSVFLTPDEPDSATDKTTGGGSAVNTTTDKPLDTPLEPAAPLPDPASAKENVVIEEARPKTLWGYLRWRVSALTGGTLTYTGAVSQLSEAERVKGFFPDWFITFAVVAGVVIALIVIGIWVVNYLLQRRDDRVRDELLAKNNTTPDNLIHFASTEELEAWKQWGAMVVRRGEA